MKLNFFNRQKKYEQYVLDGGLEYSSYYKDSIKRLKKNKMTMFCFCVIVLLVLVAIFAPLIAPYDPNMQDYANILKAPSKVTGWERMNTEEISSPESSMAPESP